MTEKITHIPLSHETPARYNLAKGSGLVDDLIAPVDFGADDIVISRRVSYRRANGPEANIGNAFRGAGLVLGAPPESSSEREFVSIPMNARPLAFEAISTAPEGAATYTSADLMHSLGELCGTANKISGGRILTNTSAERLFALVDYVEPRQRMLYLVPGSEHLLSVDVPDDPLGAQMAQFSGPFTQRYADDAHHFMRGYMAAYGEGVV